MGVMTETPPPTLPWTREVAWLQARARELTRNPADAEDLAQEVCLAALRHGAGRVRSPRAFLGSALRRLAVREGRRTEGRRRRELVVARPEACASAHDALEVRERRELLWNELHALSPAVRDALCLRYLDELGPTAIADRLGLPRETVKARLERGRTRLRSRLDETQRRSSFALGVGWLRIVVMGCVMKTKFWWIAAALVVALASLPWLAGVGDVALETSEGIEGVSLDASNTEDIRGEERTAQVERRDERTLPSDSTLDRGEAAIAEHGFVLQVVDSNGRPVAGVPVRLRRILRGKVFLPWKGTTAGEQGIATVELSDKERIGTVTAFVDGHFRVPPHVDVDLSNDPGIVTLQLPPHGRLLVNVLDASAAPVSFDGHVAFVTNPVGTFSGSYLGGDRGLTGNVAKVTRSTAEFPFVELGLVGKLQGTLDGLPHDAPFEVAVEGPSVAGERRSVDVTVSAHLFRARLLDPSGEPLRDRAVWIGFERLQGRQRYSSGPREHRTDAHGYVIFARTTQGDWPVRRFFVSTEVDPMELLGELHALRGWFTLLDVAASSRPGITDLGTHAMQPIPVRVTGRVVDDLRRPVASARVVATQHHDGEVPSAYVVPNTILGADETNAAGEFTLRSVFDDVPLRVAVRPRDGGYTEQIVLPPGRSTDVLVVLERGRTLRVEIKGAVATSSLTWTLEGERARRKNPRFEEGGWLFDHVLPGRYTLHGTYENESVAMIEGVEVTPADSPDDVQCITVDVSHTLRSARMRCVDVNGEPVAGLQATFLSRDGEPTSQTAFLDPAGRAQITVPSSRVHHDLHVPGFVSVSLDLLHLPEPIVLHEAVRAVFRLVATKDQLGDGAFLEAVFHREGGDSEHGVGHVLFDAPSQARTLEFDAPGRYRLAWRAGRKTKQGFMTHYHREEVVAPSETWVDVGLTADPIELAPPWDEVRAGWERLRER